MSLLLPLLALAAASAEPADFLHAEQNAWLSFEYGWPAAVEGAPALREALRLEMEAARIEAVGYAAEGQAAATENGYDYIPQYYAKVWQVAGSSAQLLSLSASTETFTGGAHGNAIFSAMLWDLVAQAPVAPEALLGADALMRLEPRYCRALDAERATVRGTPVRRDANDPFSLCPPLAEQVLVPQDSDGNGRFDTLTVLLAPYAAGAYAEGSYVVDVPFEEDDLAGIGAGYRPAFEPAAEASAVEAETR
jgi:peptidoglycan-N-acetylmuramic acid deacetylase PdaC-like protein